MMPEPRGHEETIRREKLLCEDVNIEESTKGQETAKKLVVEQNSLHQSS